MKYEISKDKKVISCDVSGAMFICKSTGINFLRVFPALVGLTKKRGCVEFWPARKDRYRYWNIGQSFCKKIYYDKCPANQAWLVVPSGKDYDWYRVDHLIDFS